MFNLTTISHIAYLDLLTRNHDSCQSFLTSHLSTVVPGHEHADVSLNIFCHVVTNLGKVLMLIILENLGKMLIIL